MRVLQNYLKRKKRIEREKYGIPVEKITEFYELVDKCGIQSEDHCYTNRLNLWRFYNAYFHNMICQLMIGK